MKLRQGILKVKRGTTWIKLKGGENPQCLDFRHNIILISVVVLASFGFEVNRGKMDSYYRRAFRDGRLLF